MSSSSSPASTASEDGSVSPAPPAPDAKKMPAHERLNTPSGANALAAGVAGAEPLTSPEFGSSAWLRSL